MDPRLSYREAAAAGASPLRLVSLLYEQAIEDLRRAQRALERRDIEERTRWMNHAILVIGYLESTLDKVQGGQVAANLEKFYRQLRCGLLEAQFHQSASVLEQQISHLVLVREAWDELERATRVIAPETSRPETDRPESRERTVSDWSA
ncbi:MAG TPA: flagellar export chaperone FliS [Candidatus Sulfotelmatobacter sp.]|nr:flagellar export chaperone FliS [Candidatus Sulfotelmatobacter sp.]